jgi:energy-converting hydrogenase Eha subunit C
MNASFLTAKRIKNYCLILIVVNSLMIAFSFVRTGNVTLSGAPFGGDFIEFYNAGRILNRYGSHRLYDFQLQQDLTQEYVPGFSLPYVTPPYVAILFSPLALLPFSVAYLIWIFISVALYAGAISLIARLELLPRGMTLLVCLAFPPFLMLAIAGGQISAIGCFIFALWIYLMKQQRTFLAGLVLGLLLYKPTLAVFIVPTLLFGRQFRVLMGFGTVSTVLGGLAVLMLGPSGATQYLTILREFSTLVGQGLTPAAMHVDLAAMVRQIIHVDVRYLIMLIGLPFVYLLRNNPERAIIPTMLFNSYSPTYDLILLVPLLVLTYRSVNRNLQIVVFVASFLTVPLSQFTGIQLITPVLLVLCYVLCIKAMLQSKDELHSEAALNSI